MSTESCNLTDKSCKPCEGGMTPMEQREIETMLQALPGWQHHKGQISKTYTFKNFHETMAFVNAVAEVAHKEDHHPNLEVSYKNCVIHYSTHAIGGLSENDFICAAKIDALTVNQ